MANVFEEMELGRSRVRAALTSAEGLTSQQVGETSALGKALDLPSGVVEADPARARQEMTSRRISEEELFARWAEQRKENAALARDDTDGLSNVFASAKAFGESVANAGNRAMQWLTFEAADDVQDMGRQLVHGAADLNRSLLGTAQGLSDNLFGAGSETSKALKSAQDWVKWARPEEVKGDTFLGQLGYDFVRSIPQQAGNIMAALSNPAAALSLMGIQIAGGSYAELRDQGVSPQRALISSLANATMQAPLEKIGLDRFMGIFKSANFRDTVVRTLGSMGSEFLTEYVQKYPELATNLWALAEKQGDAYEQIQWFGRTLLDAETLARANREGLYEGLIGAMWGGLGGGVRSLAIRNIERQKALDFAQRSVELHGIVEGSQTKQVAPDYMEDALDNASDVLAQSVYIPAQAALDLAAQGQDVLTPLGITADQVQQAVETGVDLEVKMSSLQSRLDAAGMAAVSQIMRQNPDAPNAVEASQVDAAAQAQAVVEETRKRQRRADAVLQEEQRLVREMLPLVGKDAAETYGKLHSSQARAFEAAYGVDAAGLMKRRSVGLEDSGTTSGASFDQTAYHGTPHRFDEFSLDAIGTGEGAQAHGWGLYFAQDKGVSEKYREKLSISNTEYRIGKKVYHLDMEDRVSWLDEKNETSPEHIMFALRELRTSKGDKEKAVDELSKKAEEWMGEKDKETKRVGKIFKKAATWLQGKNIEVVGDPGQLFEVDIPDNDVLLDEGKDFSQQPDAVVAALESLELGDLQGKSGKQIYEAAVEKFGSPRGASEAMNAAGIKGIGYDGLSDGRSFVVFDDKAIDVMQTFYQDAAQVSAYQDGKGHIDMMNRHIEAKKELDSFLNMMKEKYGENIYRDGSDEELETIERLERKAYVENPNPQDISFSDNEVISSEKDDPVEWNKTLRIEPDRIIDPRHIEEINNVTDFDKKDSLVKRFKEDGGFADNTYPIVVVKLGDRNVAITGSHRIIASREADVNTPVVDIDVDEKYSEKILDLIDAKDDITRYEVALSLRKGKIISKKAFDIIKEEVYKDDKFVLYQGDVKPPSRRAQVQLDSQTAAIRIFKGSDMSSIPHETAHIFVDDLQRVAKDDGSIARERLLSDLDQAGMDVEPFAGILSGEVDVEGARGMLRDVREELAALDDSDAGLRDAAAAAKGKDGKDLRDDISAARQQNTGRRRELLPVERMLSSYVRHLDGLEQARSDMRTLRRFAGVAEEGVLTKDQWRDVQEYAARGFEQYLAEGKAPVKELNGLFSRMMRWLKNLYASWRQYVGADLDDDVRRVFDRMLATEEQIRDDAFVSAALEYEQDFMEEVNLSADERKEIEDLRSRAEAEVTAKMDRAVARERGKRYRAAFERAKESLQASPFWTFIREMTRRDKPLTEGEASTGGINRDSLVEYLGEDMAKDIAKKMPKLVNAQGKGDTVDSLAMQYPLTDGDADALANLIYETLVTNDGSVNKLAARHAEQALAEQDREVSPEDGLLAGDAYGQYLEAVEKAMQRLGKEQQAKGELAAARRMEKERLPERYYRNIARQEVANMTVPQLRPDRYVAALRRALSDRSQAVRRGKFVEAVQAMQRARMAFAMMQEVRKARETAERVQKKARKAARVKNGTYPAAQTEAIRKLVEGLGLSAPAQAWDADAEKMTLRELVKASVDDTEVIDLMPIFPDWLLDLENPDPVAGQRGIGLDWKQLVSLEIQQVENLFDFLVHSGREQSKADKASLASRVQAVADAAAASMSGLPTYYASRRDSLGDDLDKGFSSIDSLEWQARKADGFQNVPGRKGSTEGVMERDVYGALRAATDRYHVRLNSTQRAVTPHLVRLLESAKAWEKKYGKKTLNIRDEQGDVVPVPEAIRRAGETGWTSEMVIGMALNMANDGNRERLRSSYANDDGSGGLTYDMVSLLLGDDAAATLFELDDAAMAQITAGRPRRDGILSAADWKAIQGVWDVMGSQWADTQAAHKRLYGFAPQGIDPGAFVVRVGDETVRLPGGYYPIKYDPRLDMKMRAQKGKEDILDRSEGLHGVPAARKGFTMARAKHTGRSLRLGVDALQQHLVDSARLIEFAYDVRMADKIINNPAFAAEYQRAFGIHDYDRIRPNLKALVVDEVDPDSRLYRWSELARKHLVYYALSLNLNTALMQLMAVFPAVGDVGTLAVSRGLAQLTTRGMGLVRDVWAASPYMERRFRNIDQDLARKALKFKPGRGMTLIRDGKVYTWEDVANLGMSPIAVADLVITTAIWSGAYHKHMKELRGTAGWKIDRESAYHDQAVAYADKVIAQSNPDNDALSRSAFGRDKGIVRLFNSFSGATTKFAQRTRYSLQGLRRGKVTPWEFGRMEIYDMLLPALGMTVMAALMQGAFGGDDDDNEQLAKLIVANTLGQVAMAVPVFGNPASDMIAAAMGAGSGRRGELSSALDTPLQLASTALTRGGKAYRDGEIDGEKLLMSALDIGSYLARIPVGPVARRTARGLEQWEEGEGTPFSIIKPR